MNTAKLNAINTMLRPGLLVQLKTSITGNVSYYKQDIEVTPTKHHWDTVKTTQNPEEQELAIKARGKARSAIRSACIQSKGFGLLCLVEKRDELAKAIDEANRIAMEFNATSVNTRLSVYCVTGEIIANDLQAIRGINSEVRDLLDAMRAGITDKDVDAAREAANSAVQVARMLEAEAQALVVEAVEAARKAASAIKRSDKKGTPELTEASVAATAQALNVLAAKRQSFLDLDIEIQVDQNIQRQRAMLDLDPMEASRGL